jgi:hypothetical protein
MREEFVPNNPLLKIKPEEISLLRFGDTNVEYRVPSGTFKLTFPSREMMGLAVEEWLNDASKRASSSGLMWWRAFGPGFTRRGRKKPLQQCAAGGAAK